MNVAQNNRLRALDGVNSFFRANAEHWVDDALLETLVGKSEALALQIRGLLSKQSDKVPDVTEHKKSVRLRLKRATGRMLSALNTAAEDNKEEKLFLFTSVKIRDYSSLPGEGFLDFCKKVSQRAEEYSFLLGIVGISYEKLVDYQGLVEAFKDELSAPRTASNNRSGATHGISLKMSKASEMIRVKISRAMEPYAETHPEFYHGYLKSRMVIDLGSHKEGDDPTATSVDDAGGKTA
jgi:hypothetical protein